MTAFNVSGGYDTEGMRGHVSIVPPPEPGDIRRLHLFIGDSPVVFSEYATGLEMTFHAEQGGMVYVGMEDARNDLAAMEHQVTVEYDIRVLKFGEYLLDN